MAPMAQHAQDVGAREADRAGIAQGVYIDPPSGRQPGVEHPGDAARRGVDHCQRRDRAWLDAEQAGHVPGLGEAHPLAADRVRKRLEIDPRFRGHRDQPERAAGILQ